MINNTEFPVITTYFIPELDDFTENFRFSETTVEQIQDNTWNSFCQNPIDNPLGVYIDTIIENTTEFVEENPNEGPQKMWSPKETQLLLLNMKTHGTRWSKMNINNRSVSSIRNRWSRIRPIMNIKYKNRCIKCGLFKKGHICKQGII